MNSKQDSPSWEEEQAAFEQQKDKIRAIVGNFGGRPTRRNKIINGIFILAVVTSFVMALITTGVFRAASLEIGLLLLSLKFAYFLHNEARVNHFQFWILTSIEWRLNELIKEMRENNEKMMKMLSTLSEK